MDGGVDGAHRFARCVFALHTGDGLRDGLWLLGFSCVVAVDANPVHFAPFDYLIFSDNGDIVLCGAGRNASVATCAGREIDDHSPLVVAGEFGVFIEALVGWVMGLPKN